jgi:hypothetical protein
MFPLRPATAPTAQNLVTPRGTREPEPKIQTSSFTGWHAYIKSQKYRLEKQAATTKQAWGQRMKVFTQTMASEWRVMNPQQKEVYNSLAAKQRAARQEALEKTQGIQERLHSEVPPFLQT